LDPHVRDSDNIHLLASWWSEHPGYRWKWRIYKMATSGGVWSSRRFKALSPDCDKANTTWKRIKKKLALPRFQPHVSKTMNGNQVQIKILDAAAIFDALLQVADVYR